MCQIGIRYFSPSCGVYSVYFIFQEFTAGKTGSLVYRVYLRSHNRRETRVHRWSHRILRSASSSLTSLYKVPFPPETSFRNFICLANPRHEYIRIRIIKGSFARLYHSRINYINMKLTKYIINEQFTHTRCILDTVNL